MLLDPFKIYLVGVLGSIASELVSAIRESVAIGGKCPPLYTQPFYLSIRVAFSLLVAGPLPFVTDVTNLWAVFYIGVSAPIIIDRLAKGQPELPKTSMPSH